MGMPKMLLITDRPHVAPVAPCCTYVASGESHQYPMFMGVVALLHLKCGPGGGEGGGKA